MSGRKTERVFIPAFLIRAPKDCTHIRVTFLQRGPLKAEPRRGSTETATGPLSLLSEERSGESLSLKPLAFQGALEVSEKFFRSSEFRSRESVEFLLVIVEENDGRESINLVFGGVGRVLFL